MRVHDHDQHGGHSHAGAGQRALAWTLALNGGFLMVEGAAGWWTDSLALLSDATHMLGDVGALLLAYGAARIASRPATVQRTFGLRRAGVLGGLLNGVTMLVACAAIAWAALGRLSQGAPEVAGWPVLIVGGLGLAINLGSAWALVRADRHDLNIRGALVHMLADALGSVGAMVAAVLLLYGVPAADPIVSLVIAALVLAGTWGLLRDAARVLMQLPPPGLDVQALRDAILRQDGVSDVHDLHVWTLDGRTPIATAHVVVDDARLAATLGPQLNRLLHDSFGVEHATLQLEVSAGASCLAGGCGQERAVRSPG